MLSELADKLREEAKEEGREEERQELAKSMKKEGFSFDTISRITGLSIPEIEKL